MEILSGPFRGVAGFGRPPAWHRGAMRSLPSQDESHAASTEAAWRPATVRSNHCGGCDRQRGPLQPDGLLPCCLVRFLSRVTDEGQPYGRRAAGIEDRDTPERASPAAGAWLRPPDWVECGLVLSNGHYLGLLVQSKELATLFDLLLPASVRQEAIVADADEALWQGVEKKAPQELGRTDRHDAPPAAVGIVLPAKGNGFLVHADESVAQVDKPGGHVFCVGSCSTRAGPCPDHQP